MRYTKYDINDEYESTRCGAPPPSDRRMAVVFTTGRKTRRNDGKKNSNRRRPFFVCTAHIPARDHGRPCVDGGGADRSFVWREKEIESEKRGREVRGRCSRPPPPCRRGFSTFRPIFLFFIHTRARAAVNQKQKPSSRDRNNTVWH